MISVIIPVYNTEQYLGRCIRSVKQQTYRDWECIIVNDASPDGSAELLKNAVGENKRFTVITHETNRGLPAARNTGIAVAKGDALFFLDSDDCLEPDALSYLNYQRGQHPDVGRIIGLDLIHWKSRGWCGKWNIQPSGLHKPDSKYLFNVKEDCDVGHATGCLYIPQNIPCEIQFPDVKIFEDMIFNMGLIFAGVDTFVTDKIVYHYLRHEGSLVDANLTPQEALRIRLALQEVGFRYHPPMGVWKRCVEFLERALNGKVKENEI